VRPEDVEGLAMTAAGVQKAKVLNSLVLIAAILLIIQFLRPIWFYGLVLLGIGIGLREFYSLLAREGILCFRKAGIMAGIALGLASAVDRSAQGAAPRFNIVELTLLLALLWTAASALLSRESSIVISALSGTVFGALYIGFLASYLIALRKLPDGEDFVSLAFIITWARDAGAYGVGSMLKTGHVLFPRISPRKTLEGSLAGLVFALAFALLTKLVFFPKEVFLHFIVLGCLLGVLGQAGDLVESMFKRSAGVKDTSTLLPLHGGILDRIDGLLFTAPALYYYVQLVMAR